VNDLSVEYSSGGNAVKAVNHVSFSLERGHTLGLVGETGAGKTTIAKAIIGVLPNPPAKITGGEVILNGEELLQLHDKEMQKIRGHKISMIFQDPMTALNPVMKVGSQIAEVIYKHNHVSKKEAKERAMQMLELVNIPRARYDEYPHQFSGGMKQRVVIAMALACSPELLLADEPTTALDVTIQAQVLDMMKQLKESMNTSMIMITHDLGVIAEVCDDVCVIYAGQVVECGKLSDIYDHPSHPYTIGLFHSLPKTGSNERLEPIEGFMPDPSNLPTGCYFHPRCPYAEEECRNTSVDLVMMSESHGCRCLRMKNREEK
jgi:peptide/nickel transport system ATP-binding protein